MKIKLKKANQLVKEWANDNFKEPHYVYIDFVKDDRFLNEIVDDKGIDVGKSTAEELADYAIENISKGANRANLLGF